MTFTVVALFGAITGSVLTLLIQWFFQSDEEALLKRLYRDHTDFNRQESEDLLSYLFDDLNLDQAFFTLHTDYYRKTLEQYLQHLFDRWPTIRSCYLRGMPWEEMALKVLRNKIEGVDLEQAVSVAVSSGLGDSYRTLREPYLEKLTSKEVDDEFLESTVSIFPESSKGAKVIYEALFVVNVDRLTTTQLVRICQNATEDGGEDLIDELAQRAWWENIDGDELEAVARKVATSSVNHFEALEQPRNMTDKLITIFSAVAQQFDEFNKADSDKGNVKTFLNRTLEVLASQPVQGGQKRRLSSQFYNYGGKLPHEINRALIKAVTGYPA